MNIYLKILDYKIDALKKNLYFLLDYNELTNEQVVQCSQELDKLILKYERHKKST